MFLTKKVILSAILLILATAIFFSTVMVPTTIQLIIEGDTTRIEQIPNIYTKIDVIVASLSSFMIGANVVYLYASIKIDSKVTQSNKSSLDKTSKIDNDFNPSQNIDFVNKEPFQTMQSIYQNGNALSSPTTLKQNTEAPNIEHIIKVLKDKDQIIIKEVLKAGEINQSELSTRTEIPASTLSRTLYNLEKRNLIIRYNNGMSKMVKLADFHEPIKEWWV